MSHSKTLYIRLWQMTICFLISVIVIYFTYNHTIYSSIYLHTSYYDNCNYVGFAIPTTGNGLGNHLFYYVGTLYVAWLTGRRPCIWWEVLEPNTTAEERIDKVFDVIIEHVNVTEFDCPFHNFTQDRVYVYDSSVKSLLNVSADEALWLKGAFASWKYTNPIETEVRRQLRFRHELTEFVTDFLSRSVPPGWSTVKFVRVGVHVRRGDFLRDWANSTGFTVAGERYLQRAMGYFVERFTRVQFIVASNDIEWCQTYINSSWFNESKANITFSVEHDTGQDLALLASCDHSVMTTGTFSWWAAWLTNGITVYYTDFPKNGSWLSTQMRSRDFFLPDWIGMNDDVGEGK